MSELEMTDLPWLIAEEEIQTLREIGTLEWICNLRPPPSLGRLVDITFTRTVRNKFVMGAIPSFNIALFPGAISLAAG